MPQRFNKFRKQQLCVYCDIINEMFVEEEYAVEESKRLSPDEALKVYEKEQRGKLKVFIGYAPGVGKTFTMLNEGNRRKKYGEDVVVGYCEAHGRADTDAQIGDLEVIPRQKVKFEKKELEEMDPQAIIARRPKVALIDELAHTNVPGSRNKKRYMDVEEILNQGIDVITTMNIQHMESLNDIASKIAGVKVRETIPDYIVRRADELVVVDLTPDALQNRLKRGSVYDLGKVPQALKNFFRLGNLSALRELALRETAQEVDEDLEEYMKKEGIRSNWRANEKIMVCISSNPTSKKLIRRGARLAYRYKCDWYVVSVNCTNRFARKVSLKGRQMLNGHYQLAKQLGAEVVALEGNSVSEELARWANDNHVTQVFVGYPRRTKLETLLRGSTVNKLIDKLKDTDIHLIANEK